jgi:hypothetical protein
MPRDKPPIAASRLLSNPTRHHFQNAPGNGGRLEFVGAGKVFQILVYGQIVIEREKIRQVADVLLGLFAVAVHVNTVDEHTTGRGHKQTAG